MFIIPLGHRRQFKKVVALNSVAKQIVEEQRGKNPVYVFTNRQGKQFTTYGSKSLAQCWKRAGLPTGTLIQTGVENLRDTFEHRLRVAKVSQEDIDILKGSTKADALERNQAPAVGNMIDCLEKITERVETTIVQKHNVKSNLNPGSWTDRRKWRGRRLKGRHLTGPPPTPQIEIPGV
jgi:hypothetical protein